MLLQNKDFVTVNKDGIFVVSLGSIFRKAIKDNEGNDKMLHSLESMSSLKIDDENNIKFSCQKQDKREIQITQEFYRGDVERIEPETNFQNLYNVKIWAPTLRELLVFKSIYYAETSEKIVELIMDQP